MVQNVVFPSLVCDVISQNAHTNRMMKIAIVKSQNDFLWHFVEHTSLYISYHFSSPCRREARN